MRCQWHPLVDQRLPVLYREQRRSERVAICELPDGSRAVVPVWMLKRAACETLTSGAPHASLEALRNLRRLLDALTLERAPALAAGCELSQNEHSTQNENGAAKRNADRTQIRSSPAHNELDRVRSRARKDKERILGSTSDSTPKPAVGA